MIDVEASMILIEDREKIYEYFACYVTLNIKGVIKNTDCPVYVDDIDNPTGVWVKDRYFNFVYAKEISFVKKLNDEMKEEFFGFSGTNDVVFNYFKAHELLNWKNTCSQYHFAGEKFEGVIPLDSLTIEDAEYVDEHYEYNNDDSLDKIKDAILNRPTSCIRIGGVLVSFVLLHNDDSIGYMFTLPEYRGKGYAYQLTKDIVNKTIDSGRLPYIQIVKGNHKSEQLALKAGFIKHGEVEWFGVIKIGEEINQSLDYYKSLYQIKAKSMSVLGHLRETFKPLEVKIENKQMIYKNQSYDFEVNFDDDVYYVNSDMPEDVLISGLMLVMEKEYQVCLSNQEIKSSSFKSID